MCGGTAAPRNREALDGFDSATGMDERGQSMVNVLFSFVLIVYGGALMVKGKEKGRRGIDPRA